MIRKVFAIYDTKANCFSNPIVCANKEVLIRSLRQELKNPQSSYNVAPSDFVLYSIGEYDDEKGQFAVVEKENICSLDVLVDKEV